MVQTQATCARVECGKEFNRDDQSIKYCSPECSREAILETKRRYWKAAHGPGGKRKTKGRRGD